MFVGLMSGTSIDGIDAALVSFADGPLKLLATHSLAYPQGLKQRLRDLAVATNDSVHETALADREVGQCFAQAALELLQQAGVTQEQVSAIGSHGQTIRHHPASRPLERYTTQIGDPATIAELTSSCVVADFRRQDLVAGGQGAPLTPAFHAYQFASEGLRAVVNIGGIANATLLRGAEVVAGFDCGPGNTLLDNWTRLHLDAEFDVNGAWSAEHPIDEPLLTTLLADPYFSRTDPRNRAKKDATTGRYKLWNLRLT